MTRLDITTYIAAPPERCFDLSRSIDLHLLSAVQSGEQVIAGRTTGLIDMGETVTWEARHFGIKQRLTTRITAMNRPEYFSDTMVAGAFKSMHHQHHFRSSGNGTVMTDNFCYEVPYAWAGRLFDCIALKNHMLDFLSKRNEAIKDIAEGDKWMQLLNNRH